MKRRPWSELAVLVSLAVLAGVARPSSSTAQESPSPSANSSAAAQADWEARAEKSRQEQEAARKAMPPGQVDAQGTIIAWSWSRHRMQLRSGMIVPPDVPPLVITLTFTPNTVIKNGLANIAIPPTGAPPIGRIAYVRYKMTSGDGSFSNLMAGQATLIEVDPTKHTVVDPAF